MRNKIIISLILYIGCILLEATVAIPYALTLILYLIPYLIVGLDVLKKVSKNIRKGRVFDERFLMTIATVAAFVIGEYAEGVAAMLFYQVGELFEHYAVHRSRKSISSLMDIMPEYANMEKDGEIVSVSPKDIQVGSTIIVKPGEKIPLDGIVISGQSHLDTAALTGESKHTSVNTGDEILSGSINCEGVLYIKTTKSYENSTVSKILELVENASSRKAPAENFITKFASYYTPIIVILSILLGVATPLLFDKTISEGIYRACIFLVVSCPCALVISVPLSFFGGIGAASRQGILVKGSNFLEILSKTDTFVFDKTGTLTKGVFEVNNIYPAEKNDEILSIAALCEAYCNHPIAISIKDAYEGDINTDLIQNYEEISGKGIKTTIKDSIYLCGNAELMQDNNIKFTPHSGVGTVIYITKDNTFIGSIEICDKIKEEATKAIQALKATGITKTAILSGDNEEAAKNVSKQLRIDKVYSELLPADKVNILEKILSTNHKVAYVGDGINDAPVLMRADVGISMSSIGSDAAIEASDIVLINDDISKLATIIKIAKKTVAIASFNIVFAIGVKFLILFLGALGIANMWLAIFADVGVSVLAILNAMRTFSVK